MFKIDKIIAEGVSVNGIDSVAEWHDMAAFLAWATTQKQIQLKLHLKPSNALVSELFKLASASDFDAQTLKGLLDKRLDEYIQGHSEALDGILNSLRADSASLNAIGFVLDVNDVILDPILDYSVYGEKGTKAENLEDFKGSYIKAKAWYDANKSNLPSAFVQSIPKEQPDHTKAVGWDHDVRRDPMHLKLIHLYRTALINGAIFTRLADALPRQLTAARNRPIYHGLFHAPMTFQFCTGNYIEATAKRNDTFNIANTAILALRHDEHIHFEKALAAANLATDDPTLRYFLETYWGSTSILDDQIRVHAETTLTLDVETMTLVERQVETHMSHEQGYRENESVPALVEAEWRQALQMQLVDARHHRAVPPVAPEASGPEGAAREQWLMDHVLCPIQDASGKPAFHPDFTWTPGVSELSSLQFSALPFKGAANQSGGFYANFWTQQYHKATLGSVGPSIHTYTGNVTEEVEPSPFASVPNISSRSITHTDLHYRNLGQNPKVSTDGLFYYPEDTALIQAIQDKMQAMDIVGVNERALENVVLRFGDKGLEQLKTLIDPDAAEITRLYFSTFKQLDYFVEEAHIGETRSALESIRGLSCVKQDLLLKLMGNIGFSRQPLDKIVTAYTVFLKRLEILGVDPSRLGRATWQLPKSGYAPIELMGALDYILTHAQAQGCLEAQLESLDGLVITRLTLIPIFMQGAKMLCQEMMAPLMDSSPTLLLKHPFEAQPKSFTFETVANWGDILSRVITHRDLFQFFVSEVPFALSVKQLKTFFSASNTNDTLLFPQNSALFVLFVHRLEDKPTDSQVEALFKNIMSLDQHHIRDIANYLIQNKGVTFDNTADITSFLETFHLFDGKPLQDKIFWLQFWREHNLAAKAFYAAVKVSGQALFSAQLPTLRALKPQVEGEPFTPYVKAMLVALCEDVEGFNLALQTKLFALQNVAKINVILAQIVSSPHYYNCRHLTQFLDSEETDEGQLVTLLLGAKPKTVKIDFSFSSVDGKDVQEIVHSLASRNARIRVGMSAEQILTTETLDSSDQKALALAFYKENVLDVLQEGALKTLVATVYQRDFVAKRTLFKKNQCQDVIMDCLALDATDYASHPDNQEVIHRFLESVYQQHGLDVFKMALTLLKNLHRAYQPLLDVLQQCSSEQQAYLLPYCAELALKKMPLKRILEVASRLKGMDPSALRLSADFISNLAAFFETHPTHPSLTAILTNTTSVQPEKHALLFALLGNRHSDTIERFIHDASPVFFNQIIMVLGKANFHRNADRLPEIFEWLMRSFCQSETINFPIDISMFVSRMLEESDDNFSSVTHLFEITTPTLNRLFETLSKGINTFDGLMHDPRGNRKPPSVSPSAALKAEREANITRVMEGLTIDSAKKGVVVEKGFLRNELAYLINATENLKGIYKGKGPSQLSTDEIADYLRQIRSAKGMSFAEKARVALPLIEEALAFSTGMRLNDTQRIALLQAIHAPTRVLFQNILTGEGKSLTDMCKCALLWSAGEGCVEYTTSSLPDAKAILDEFKRFFTLLRIPTSDGVIHSSSSASAFKTDGVNFSTVEEYGLWCFQNGRPVAGRVHAVLNESDSVLLDGRLRIPMRVATPDPLLKDNPWIYEGINAYFAANRSLPKETVMCNIQHQGIQDFLRTFSKGKPFEKQSHVLDLITADQYRDLFISAYWASQLQEHGDYKILEGNNGKRYVHPMVGHRATWDIYTHFSSYVHGLLCAEINARPEIIQQGLTVEIPPKTNSQAEGNTTGFVRSQLDADPGNILWASSGTTVGSEEEKAFLVHDLGEAVSFATMPMDKPLQRKDNASEEYTNEDAQFDVIARRIGEIKRSNSQQPILVCFKDDLVTRRFNEFALKNDALESFRIQAYDGTPQGEKAFVDAASRDGMISLATPALGRNTNIENRDNLGLAVICAAKLSKREELQMLGRAGRNGSPGVSFRIFNAEDTLLERPRELNAWDPCRDVYDFMTMLSLSKPWLALKDNQKKEAFITAAHQASLDQDSWGTFLREASLFDVAEDRDIYQQLVDTFVRRLSPQAPASFTAILSPGSMLGQSPVELLKAQYRLEPLAFLRETQPVPASIYPSLISGWLSSEAGAQEAEFDYVKRWFMSGEIPSKEALTQAVVKYIRTMPIDGLIQNPCLASLLKAVSPSSFIQIAIQSQLTSHFTRHGATPELLKAVKTLQKEVYPTQSLLGKELIVHLFNQYKTQSTFYIGQSRKDAMKVIIEKISAPNCNGDYFKLIHEQSKAIIEGDIRANARFFRYLKPLHLLGKSRFVSMLETMLPILEATRPSQPAIVMRALPQPHRFFGKGLDQVVQQYNTLTAALAPK